MAEKKQNTEKAVATKGSTAVALGVNFGADAGAGTKGLGEDRVIPILGLLATNSPQVQKGHQRYIAGAEPGMAVNKGTKKLYELREGDGMVIVPVDRQKWFVKYRDRDSGGGFLGRFAPTDPYILNLTGGKKVFGKILDPEDKGAEIIETNYVPVLILDGPGGKVIDVAVMPFKSKQLGPWSEWATLVESTMVHDGEEKPLSEAAPMFAHQIRVTARFESSAKGDFWNYVLTPAVADEDGNPNVIASLITDRDHPAYKLGRKILAEFNAGEREIGEHENDDDEAPAGKSVFEK